MVWTTPVSRCGSCCGLALAEYQSGCRVQADMTDRDPFCLDAVQAAVGPEAPVAPEALVL